MRLCIGLSLLIVTGCHDTQQVLTPIELPFSLADVTRIEAVSVRSPEFDLNCRSRETFAKAGLLLEPREVPREHFTKLFGVITQFVTDDGDSGTLCLPVYRDYLDLYDAYGMQLMTIDICFDCRAVTMTGPLGRTYQNTAENYEARTLADIMASVGYTENLPDEYFTHAALAGASKPRP